MSLLNIDDFKSRAGQEKIIKTIHLLDFKVAELGQKVHELEQKQCGLERDLK